MALEMVRPTRALARGRAAQRSRGYVAADDGEGGDGRLGAVWQAGGDELELADGAATGGVGERDSAPSRVGGGDDLAVAGARKHDRVAAGVGGGDGRGVSLGGRGGAGAEGSGRGDDRAAVADLHARER